MTEVRDEEVDISETGNSPVRGRDDSVTIDHGYKNLPLDLPLYMRVTRHVDDEKKKLLGWTTELDILARGKVSIKITPTGPWKILVDGVEVYKGDHQ